MAALIRLRCSTQAPRSTHPGAWIVSRPGQEHGGGLAEGPPLDLLLATTPGLTLRPATPLERLLGRPAQPRTYRDRPPWLATRDPARDGRGLPGRGVLSAPGSSPAVPTAPTTRKSAASHDHGARPDPKPRQARQHAPGNGPAGLAVAVHPGTRLDPRVLPAAGGAPVPDRPWQPDRRHQARPGGRPGPLPGPRAAPVGSAAVRPVAGPGGGLPVPDGAVLRPRPPRGPGAVGDPAAVDRHGLRRRLRSARCCSRPAGHRLAVVADRGRPGLRRLARRAHPDRRPVLGVPPGGDAAVDPAPAGPAPVASGGRGGRARGRGPVRGGRGAAAAGSTPPRRSRCWCPRSSTC